MEPNEIVKEIFDKATKAIDATWSKLYYILMLVYKEDEEK